MRRPLGGTVSVKVGREEDEKAGGWEMGGRRGRTGGW